MGGSPSQPPPSTGTTRGQHQGHLRRLTPLCLRLHAAHAAHPLKIDGSPIAPRTQQLHWRPRVQFIDTVSKGVASGRGYASHVSLRCPRPCKMPRPLEATQRTKAARARSRAPTVSRGRARHRHTNSAAVGVAVGEREGVAPALRRSLFFDTTRAVAWLDARTFTRACARDTTLAVRDATVLDMWMLKCSSAKWMHNALPCPRTRPPAVLHD